MARSDYVAGTYPRFLCSRCSKPARECLCATAKCRSCGAPMKWVQTPRGKFMPLNADFTSHFATCTEKIERKPSASVLEKEPRPAFDPSAPDDYVYPF